jgi:hypothetical protein
MVSSLCAPFRLRTSCSSRGKFTSKRVHRGLVSNHCLLENHRLALRLDFRFHRAHQQVGREQQFVDFELTRYLALLTVLPRQLRLQVSAHSAREGLAARLKQVLDLLSDAGLHVPVQKVEGLLSEQHLAGQKRGVVLEVLSALVALLLGLEDAKDNLQLSLKRLYAHLLQRDDWHQFQLLPDARHHLLQRELEGGEELGETGVFLRLALLLLRAQDQSLVLSDDIDCALHVVLLQQRQRDFPV